VLFPDPRITRLRGILLVKSVKTAHRLELVGMMVPSPTVTFSAFVTRSMASAKPESSTNRTWRLSLTIVKFTGIDNHVRSKGGIASNASRWRQVGN
jgi:hypothetical protein